jgi:Periplasmic component of the Tol biopolymer transport system
LPPLRRGSEVFNLFEFSVDGTTARQLTHTTGGALWPDVSPDGKSIVFVGYTTDGDDLFAMPYPAPNGDAVPALAFRPTGGTNERHGASAQEVPSADVQGTATDYSPIDTLKPTSWTPILEADSDQVRLGAGITGYDVLGYHGYAASATWLVSSPAGAPTLSAATPDWQLSYVYNRWRPAFYLAASSTTSFFAGPATELGAPTAATRRELQVEGGLIVQVRHTRVQHVARLAAVRAVADYTTVGKTFSRDRTPLRMSWETLTGRTYGYSISPEDGVALGATTEIVRRELGSFADATTTTADARAYLPGLAPHHVVALRVGGGASIGDPTVGRTFCSAATTPAPASSISAATRLPCCAASNRIRSRAATSPSRTWSTDGRSHARSAGTGHGRCFSTRCTQPFSLTLEMHGRAPLIGARPKRRRARSSRPISSPVSSRHSPSALARRGDTMAAGSSAMASPPTSASAKGSRYDLIVCA